MVLPVIRTKLGNNHTRNYVYWRSSWVLITTRVFRKILQVQVIRPRDGSAVLKALTIKRRLIGRRLRLSHLWVEYAEDLDGGDVNVDDLVGVGPGVEQTPPYALAQQHGQALVLLGHPEGGLRKRFRGCLKETGREGGREGGHVRTETRLKRGIGCNVLHVLSHRGERAAAIQADAAVT